MAFRGENFVHMWVNYDHDTQTVRDSYNIASVTDVGTGRLTFNFSTNATNANYAYSGIAGNSGTTTAGRTFSNEGTALGSFSVRYRSATAVLDDALVTVICVAKS